MRVIAVSILIIGLIGVAGTAFASEKTEPPKTSTTIEAAAPGDEAVQEYEGLIIKTDNHVTLLVGDSTYVLQGKDVAGLPETTVKVSGKLFKGEKINTILVAKVETIKDKKM